MKVKELIGKLQKVDQDAEVTTWDPYSDCETLDVCLSLRKEGQVLITNTYLGDAL